jgi:hypothetical protein
MTKRSKTRSAAGNPARKRARLIPVLGTVLLVAFAVTMLGGEVALAGKKPEKKPRRAEYVNNHPPLHFLQGRLGRDAMGNWKVTTTTVVFTAESRLVSSKDPDRVLIPREGMEVALMGYRSGSSLVVRFGSHLDRPGLTTLPMREEGVTWSETGAPVGEGEGPH